MLSLRHLDHVFGQLLIVSHQLGSIERRQQKLARRLTWLVHEVRVAFEEARANETGSGSGNGHRPERGRHG
jgi:hypothetical protein